MPQFVNKIRLAVRVAMPREAPIDGQLSLEPQAEFHTGPETLLERLNSPDRVIPFQRERDGAMMLLNRLDIEWVSVAPGASHAPVQPPTYRVTREEYVQVRFMNGSEAMGRIQMELPEDLNRASDFLNGADDFFPLVTPHSVMIINKNRVSTIRVYERSPLPVGHDPHAADEKAA